MNKLEMEVGVDMQEATKQLFDFIYLQTVCTKTIYFPFLPSFYLQIYTHFFHFRASLMVYKNQGVFSASVD